MTYMITTLKANLKDWALKTDSRQKLQHTYLVTAIVLVLSAGVIGLIEYDMGQRVLLGAFIALAVYVANAVVWALLQSFVLFNLTAASGEEATTLSRAPKPTVQRKK